MALAEAEDTQVGSAPDLALDVFAKNAKRKATKAKKLAMQKEVDQPDSYFLGGPEFDRRTALMPRRPWLFPRLPVILPPTVGPFRVSDTDPDDIQIPDSDDPLDHIDIPDSDNSPHDTNSDGIPDHLSISNSQSSSLSDIYVQDSDNMMDVDQSDEQTTAAHYADTDKMPVVHTDSESDSVDHIELSDGPEYPGSVIGGSGVTDGLGRDPTTGRFTAASFANVPDDLLD